MSTNENVTIKFINRPVESSNRMDHQPKTQSYKIHEDDRMETYLRNHAQSTPTVITRSARTL